MNWKVLLWIEIERRGRRRLQRRATEWLAPAEMRRTREGGEVAAVDWDCVMRVVNEWQVLVCGWMRGNKWGEEKAEKGVYNIDGTSGRERERVKKRKMKKGTIRWEKGETKAENWMCGGTHVEVCLSARPTIFFSSFSLSSLATLLSSVCGHHSLTPISPSSVHTLSQAYYVRYYLSFIKI